MIRIFDFPMTKSLNFLGSIVLFMFCTALYAQEEAKEYSWPLEINSKEGFVITLYQPQLESFQSNILEGRMAVTVKPKDGDMVFGAVWFEAMVATDTENRTVLLDRMHILKWHFPEIMDDEKKSKFSSVLTGEIESWSLEMSLDRLLASLDEVENLKQLSDNINNDPPKIYFRTSPTVLLMIDGEPILKTDQKSGLEYVVNTAFFIVKDSRKEDYYLKGGPFWYTSKQITTGWAETKKVPSKIKRFAKEQIVDSEQESIAQSYTEAPEVLVDTKPAELVVVDGKIDYKPIDGTSLLYVSNTENDIIMDINSQNHYILLAGRWYYSKSLQDGDWKFSEPENLPEDFKNIPANSSMESVRASIPGTPEAQTSVLEQSIPQTATIDRKTAKLDVTYDGDPKFEAIDGTAMSYAVNTDKSVLIIDQMYYCVDDGVWFWSTNAKGPWEVCTERPDAIDELPPESPVYNVKYTYIYDSTPDVVYVGYLPGYTYSYVYGGVVVYGAGYYYRPWYGYYYYPRPVTWGYGVHYNPYTGWGFSYGFNYGWVGWGFHPYSRGYWGRGYYTGYRHGYSMGYHQGVRQGYRAGYNAGPRYSSRNVYNNRSSGVMQTSNRSGSNIVNNKARPSNKSNNIYAGRSGSVYQRDNTSGNFQNKSNIQQRPPQSQPRPSQNQSQQLNRAYQNRNEGTQNYNRSQQQRFSAARPASASRPGGASGVRKR